MDWLKTHEYLAAWLGPLIGIIALIRQQTVKATAFDFKTFTIYLTFFILLGFKVASFTNKDINYTTDIFLVMCFFAILYDQRKS